MQNSFAGCISRYGKDASVVAQTFVFLHDLKGNVKQTDIRFHAGLLPVGVYPHAVVERVGHDVFIPEVLQVDIGQSRKGAEKEQIVDERPFEVHLRGIDKQPEFLLGEEALFCFFFRYTAVREWVAHQPAVLQNL